MRALRSGRGVLATCAVAALLWRVDGLAQSGNANLSGRVTDPSNAVLPDVRVVVTNDETGVTREVSTNERGQFIVPNLQAGTYHVGAERDGLQRVLLADVVLNVGQTRDLQIQLPIARMEQRVMVNAEGRSVNMSAGISSVVTEASLRQLPLDGRRWEDLAALTPGVVRANGTISVGGLKTRGMISYNIDGFDFNTSMFGVSRGGDRPPFQMSQEAVKEFQVAPNGYSAEFGRVGGAIINAVTRAGTNTWHGSVFDYARFSALDARSAFASVSPDDRRQQFGGTVGGPIRRDRLFLFVSSDNQFESDAVVVTAGDALNNVRNVTQADVAAALERFRGDAAVDGALTAERAWNNFVEVRSFIQGELGSHPRSFNQSTLFSRLDWTMSPRLNLNVRYNYQTFRARHGLIADAVLTRALENTGTTLVGTHSVGTEFNAVLRPSLVLQTKVQVARDDQPDEFATGQVSAIRAIPSEMRITDGRPFQFGPLNFLPREIKETRYQIAQNATHLRGSHSLKAGVDVGVVQQDNLQTRMLRGQYNFSNLVNFAIGAYQSFAQNLGDPAAPQTAVDYAGYIQDEWRAKPSLSVNLGLRYDLQTFTQPTHPNPLVPETAHIPVDKNNVGPRLAISWFPGSEPRTVFRAGYGLAYVRTLTVDTEIFLFRNGVARQLATFLGPDNASGSDAHAPVFPATFDQNLTIGELGLPLSSIEVGLAAPNRVNGEVQHANGAIEHRFRPSVTGSIGWLFVKGTHLTGKITENVGSVPIAYRDVAVVGADNRQIGTVRGVPNYDAARNRPNPQLGDMFVNRSEFNALYNALFVTLHKRFSRNHQLSLAYTWSKAFDDNPQQEGASISAPFGQKGLNRGPSDSDQRHRFVASGTFQLPAPDSGSPLAAILRGWQLGAIVGIDSALPFSPLTGTALTRIRNGEQLAPADSDGPYTLSGRNSVRGFSQFQNDVRVTRSFDLKGRSRLELLAEVFNVTNRTNFLAPTTAQYNFSPRATFVNSLGTTVQAERLQVNPSFGQPGNAGRPRKLQFAVRWTF